MWHLSLLALAAPKADEVVSLPGWKGELPSKIFSGYIDVSAAMGNAMQVHYLYIESESPGGPTEDPTILWTNGGPGASSMFGIFVELGPLILNQDSLRTSEFNKTGVPTLYRNPYAWSKLGNVLMFDWPPPVGFSYCDGQPSGNGTSCGDWDDERMTQAMYAALSAWFGAFPERVGKPLYLTGESYAGVYVPKLAQRILDLNDHVVTPMLRGFAVGDGCMGSESGVCGSGLGPWWQILFLYGHGQISTLLFDRIVDACGMSYLKSGTPSPAPVCLDALSQVAVEAGGYFAYGLYDDCIYQEGLRAAPPLGGVSDPAGARRAARHKSLTPAMARLLGFSKVVAGGGSSPVGGAVNDYVCGGGDAQTAWTGVPAVRKALHVPLDALFFNGDNGEGMVYRSTEKDLVPFYARVGTSTSLRVLVYNGDTDPSINSFQAQNWTASLGFPATAPWRPWTLDGCRRMGGYVTQYAQHRLDYLTIRGSGHMVPQMKPAAALAFMRSWIAQEDYKPYDEDCKQPPASAGA